MAYSDLGWYPINANVNPKLLGYVSSADTLATIAGSDYFASAEDQMPVNTIIFVTGSDGQEMRTVTAVDPITTAAYVATGDIGLTNTYILVGNASGKAIGVAMSGDATLANTGALTVAAGAIDNAKVDAAAAIDYSKLAALTDGNILVGNGSNVATSVAMSGDVTIANTGATTIAAGAIDLAMLSAGITPSSIIVYDGKESNGGGSATVAITVTGVLDTDRVFAQIEASTNAVNVQKVTPTADTITVLLSGDPGASTIISYQAIRTAA